MLYSTPKKVVFSRNGLENGVSYCKVIEYGLINCLVKQGQLAKNSALKDQNEWKCLKWQKQKKVYNDKGMTLSFFQYILSFLSPTSNNRKF